jgi:Flp pilus assembly protein TadB
MVHESYYSTGEERERERKKKRATKRNETTTTEREGGGGGGARGVQKKKRAREREREREKDVASHRHLEWHIACFHKMYLVICPVVSNLFSLRSTYIAAVLYIPDPLLSRRSARKKNRRTLKGEF